MNYENYHIYVVEGAEQLKICADLKAERKAASMAQHKWCVSHGGIGTMCRGPVPYALLVKSGKAPKDEANWRLDKSQSGVSAGRQSWVPNRNTATGRKLAKDLAGLLIPDCEELAVKIGASACVLQVRDGQLCMVVSSCFEVGDRFILIYPKGKKGGPRKLRGLRRIKLSEFYAIKEAAEPAAA